MILSNAIIESMFRLICILVTCFVFSGSFLDKPLMPYPLQLSAWNIFEGKLNLLHPKKGLVPYSLNTPLFSDYAEKLRFIRLPKNSAANYTATGSFDFPQGTLLIKNFYYSADFRKPGVHKNIIETRLLVKEAEEWKALTYIWNEEQTDAFLEIAGDEKQIHFINKEGDKQEVRYVVPNQNQCKGCHNVNEKLMPIGTSASQLNGNFTYLTGKKNQLDYWKQMGLLHNMPSKNTLPRTAVWNEPSSGSLDKRARAYLAINCGHCHKREGPAQTSGLFLTETENNITAIGINKPPIAAGKASGGRMVDILPGNASGSIMWYRMQSHVAGERMPELGRTTVHTEGVALIKEWIDKMKS